MSSKRKIEYVPKRPRHLPDQRGGEHKSKKDYKRRPKYKKDWSDDDDDK